MPLKTVEYGDFSGGLATAIDKSALAMNCSPDLSNVALLDSRAITRRSGYADTLAATFTSASPNAMHRAYRLGVKQWVSVCGTAAWASAGGAFGVWERTESDGIQVSTHPTVSNPSYSGGGAVRVPNAAESEFSLPSCTTFRTWFNAVNASMSIDGGAWANVSGPLYTSATLSATAHTVKLKYTVAAGSVSMKLVPSSGTTVGYVRKDVSALTSPPSSVKLYFYDDGTALTHNWGLFGTTNTGYHHAAVLAEGATHYWWQAKSSAGASTVPRSIGWHSAEFVKDGALTEGGVTFPTYAILIDGSTVATGKAVGYVGTSIRVAMIGPLGATLYMDNITVNGAAWDACDSLTGWSSANGTASISAAQAFDNTSLDVDYFERISASAWTKIDSTLTASSETFGIATYNSKTYYNSPYDTLRVYNPLNATTPVTAVTSGPAGGFMVECKRRLFTAGKATQPDLVEWCAVDNPDDWTTSGDAGSIRFFGKESGHESTGLAVWNDNVFYFSKSGTAALTVQGATTAWVNRVLSKRIGCIAPKSVTAAPNAVVWLSSDAVYAYGNVAGVNSSDGSQFYALSEGISPTIAALSDTAKEGAIGSYYDRAYWLVVDADDTGVRDTVLVYRFARDGLPGAWTRYRYLGIDITSLHVTRGDEYGLYAGCAGGRIVRLDQGEADGSYPIVMKYRMPPIAPKGYRGLKHFRTLYVAADSVATQDVSVTPQTDDIAPSAVTVSVGAQTGVRPMRVPLSARGRSIELTLQSSGSSQPLTVNSVSVAYMDTNANR